MAKNWSAKEAAEVILEGKDKVALLDIGRRFPMFSMEVAKIGIAGKNLFESLEWVTARKIDKELKGELDEGEGEEEAVETPVPKKAAKSVKEAAKPAKEVKPVKAAKKAVVEEEDEDEEDEVPVKKSKKPAAAPAKPVKGAKPAKKAKVEDEDEDIFDDDDDFDDED